MTEMSDYGRPSFINNVIHISALVFSFISKTMHCHHKGVTSFMNDLIADNQVFYISTLGFIA